MDKILIGLYVPATGQTYDIFIPYNDSVENVLELIKKAIAQISEGYFVSNNLVSLALRKTGYILDINKSAREQNLKNGSQLMLI